MLPRIIWASAYSGLICTAFDNAIRRRRRRHAAEDVADLIVGDIVVVGDEQGVGEECLGVLPLADLHEGGDREGDQRDDRSRDDAIAERFAAGCDVAGSPGDEDEQADMRQIGVAIRHRLSADLHETDDGDEHAQNQSQPTGSQGRVLCCQIAMNVMPTKTNIASATMSVVQCWGG